MTFLAAVAAAGLAFITAPASAAPSYGAGPATATGGIDLSRNVYWHHRHGAVVVHHGRRCWWRHGVKVCRW